MSTGEMTNKWVRRREGLKFGVREKIICPVCGQEAYAKFLDDSRRTQTFKHITKIPSKKPETARFVTKAVYCEQKYGR